jgi:hypothetical protein
MTEGPAAAVPAGWYPAPHAAGQLRYWDGLRWHDVPAPAPASPAVRSTAGVEHRGNQVGRIALVAAIAGTIFACWPGWFLAGWVLLPAAFVIGVVAVALPGRTRGYAVAAIGISTVGTIAGFSVFFSPVFDGFGDATSSECPRRRRSRACLQTP